MKIKVSTDKYSEPDDDELFQRIVKGDEKALEKVYKKYYSLITRYVLANSGTMEEAVDVYQEGIIIFWRNARSQKLVLTSKIGTYIYAICKNIWLKDIGRKKRFEPLASEEDPAHRVEEMDTEKQKALTNCLNKLDDKCKRLLMLYYFDELSMQQIADELGYANMETAKTQKYKCMKKLTDIVQTMYSKQDFYE